MASSALTQSSSFSYDVFLSFHATDTRSNFTDFLFQALIRKGIVAFKDESRAPDQAIEGSRLFIVVLSKNYASSTRCLRELSQIFHCVEFSPRRVLPIFYDVDPSDVRKQTGWYEKAFSKYEERFLVNKKGMEIVQTWRKALTQVANLSGWYIRNKPQHTEIEEFVQYTISILGPKFSTLQNEAEGTSSDKDEVSYNELSGLMRIRDFISLVLTYPVKLEEEDILRSWISAFPEWKAQLLSTGDDTVMDKPWCVLTEKALGSMKGFMPMEIISKVESGRRSIFSHNDVEAIPEAILHQTVDLAVNQLIQTLFSGDNCARYIRLLTRNLAEKRYVVDKIVAAVEDKHNMFGIDKDFLRALWINASTYETDAEFRVQEEINTMMEVDDMWSMEVDNMLGTLFIQEKTGSNGQLVIVVDADSNKKLDLQKLRFPTGIVVLITTEPSTQAEKDGDFRIACTMDLNIWTQDHLLPWKVFCSYVGSCISSSMVSSSMAIQKIAVEIVKECHGHLLAIVLLSKYLMYVQDFKQWELALDKLSSLSPSYDYQDSDRIGISRVMVNAFVNIIWEDIDDAQKLCLELSLPVHNIKNGVRDDILVSDWAKIILGYMQEVGEYRRQLQYYMKELLDRFVLLKYESGDVYLPIETYDIIKSLHTSKPSILRHGALGLTEPPYIGRWHSLIQIELMDNKICELPQSPDCPKLKVLLLQGNVDLMDIPDSFFNHMPLLQHLDLSYTSIRDLPPSVSKLIQLQKFYLRGCDLFMELPHQIGQLKNLKELDLDGTLITHLPIEIRELINLQSLSLCFDVTSRSTIIPPGLVSNLTELNYLSINVDPEDERWNENVTCVLREICLGLWNLQRLSIYVPKADLLEFIPAQSSLNFRLVVGQHMRRLISRVPPELETKFKHCDYSIKFVNGVNVPNGVKMNLWRFKALYLDRHMTIKSLSDFDLRNLWGLEVCILAECNEMETIVSGSNSPDGPASLMLKFLSVFYMKNLRSVCEGSSSFFLCLKSIALHTCPMLTTIFTLDSLKKLSFLEEIIVEDCPKVTTLISHATPEQKSVFFFLPKLRIISLLYLPELVNIFNGMHVGPFIEEMIFYYCPRLQSLSKSELSSKSLKIIKGESIWWEALKWNVAEWGDAGRPNYFERIFSPINEEADMMNQLAALQETQLNEYHNTTYQGISSSKQSIAKILAPVSSVGRGSSNSEAQKRKVVAEPKIFQEVTRKLYKTINADKRREVWTAQIRNSFSGAMPKRKGRGRPKGSHVQKEVKESADGEFVIPPNIPLNVLKSDPDFIEEQEEGTIMPKKKGQGQPKGSQAKNCQESAHGNLNSCTNPSNMVEVAPGCEEPEDEVVPNKNGQEQPRGLRRQYCEENADCENFYSNPSNMMEVSPGYKEEKEDDAVDVPRKGGLWQPRESINHENHQQNADGKLDPKRKGRGQTRGLTLQRKRRKSADGKLDVLIHPTKLVAVGPGRNDFITDLSLIVRQNARLNVLQWKKVPQSTRDTIVQNILNNWRLRDTDMVRKAILRTAGRLYQNWRSRLHDYYLKFETKEEALKHVPDDINDSDWQFLVDYFSSPYFEIMSVQNKANKAKHRIHHTAGSKSFLAVSNDARDPVTGKEPDLQTFCQLTHKRGNGEWIDEASKEINDKVAEQTNEKRCQIEDSPEVVETTEQENIDTAFKTMVGKKSFMQGFGAGLRSSSSSSSTIQQLQAELDAQKKETENARKECNEIRARLVEVESCLEEERLKRKEIEARLSDRQNEMQEISSQVQTTIQAALSQYLPQKTEAQTSSKNKRKVAELEALLHEAEDVITDIRSELIRHLKSFEVS
ncbi:Disease resistance protein [Glycine max]|nr:Disease resistance protein [Glycine max]